METPYFTLKPFAISYFSVLLTLVPAPQALADTMRETVRSQESGTILRSALSGACVRTKWDSWTDPCAPPRPLPPALPITYPVPVAPPQLVIAQAERTVYFGFDKYHLTQRSRATLGSLAVKLQADTEIREARVVGYADRIGSQEYNIKLSEKRAEGVRDYLISRGFARMGNTDIRWLGESVPRTNCPKNMARAELIKCLAEDRRVEVEIDYLTRVPARPTPQPYR